MSLSWLSIFLCMIAAQGAGDIGNLWLGYDFLRITSNVSLDVGLVLLYTTICDIVCYDAAGWRWGINITFYILGFASAVLVTFAEGPPRVIGGWLRSLTLVYSSVFMVAAHCKLISVSLHLSPYVARMVPTSLRQFTHLHHGHRSCASTRK